MTTIAAHQHVQRFAIAGMTCGSCVKHVRKALEAVPGVARADVSLETASVTVAYADAQAPALALLQGAVATAGYALAEPTTLDWAEPEQRPAQRQTLLRPIRFGLIGSLALLAFYLGLVTLAQDWAHATDLLLEDLWFVVPIIVGFGIQVGLMTYLRGMRVRASRTGLAASTGTSTVAMVACCAHHLVELAPVLGLSGAVVFLNAYKAPLMGLGLLMNLAGILWMARKVWQCRSACSSDQAPAAA